MKDYLNPSVSDRLVAPARSFLDALALLAMAALAWKAVDPAPIQAAGLRLDRATAAFGLLVAGIGAITVRYAIRALAGDPGRDRFAGLLAATTFSAWVAAMADFLPLMLGAWLAQGLALHGLLTIRADRPQALLPARTSFLASRFGDALMAAATIVAWQEWHTLDVSALNAAASGSDAPHLTAVAVLVALAAVAKSAQVPFHAWLPETMEAPTPVSAMMHAGVVNAGGVLLVRFAPVVVQVPAACLVLVVAGTLTIAIGMPAMWAQVKVKRELAWSTVAQMGFMTVQCGLGAFPAAALHVVGHGCYKAWSFLRAGDVPPPPAAPPRFGRALALLAVGSVTACPVIALVATWTGLDVLHSPGECAMAAVLALSVGQAWVAVLGRPSASPVRAGASCLGIMAIAAVVGPLAWIGMSAFLAPAIGTPMLESTPFGWTLAALPVATMIALAVLHAALPGLDRYPAGFAFHVHALNGFYLGTASDRLVTSAWPNAGSAHPKESHA